MKNLTRLAVASVLLAVGYKPLVQSNVLNFGSDNYKVQWTGTNGSNLFGSYVITSRNFSTPSRAEKVVAKLPYEITFSAPKNALISAAGTSGNQGIVEVKIFKNGLECGNPTVVGSGVIPNKLCQ